MATYTLRKILYVNEKAVKFNYSAENPENQSEQSSLFLIGLAHIVAHSDFNNGNPKSEFKDFERRAKPAIASPAAYLISDALSPEEFISFVSNYLSEYNKLNTSQREIRKLEAQVRTVE